MKKKQMENGAKRASSLIHGKPAKKIAALCLAGAMTLPLALSLGACGRNGNGNTTNSNGNQTQHGTTNYSQYSKLLQDVLNNPEYDELYRQYESGEMFENCEFFDSGVNQLEAIPYDFLAAKGEDVEGIKIGAVRANSMLYTREDEKNYIYDKLDLTYKVEGGENYINQYLLKYRISEQELKDLTMLYEGDYYQGPIMFQYLASQREPEVVAEFSIYEDTYKSFIKSLNGSDKISSLFKNKIEGFSVTGFKPNADKEDYYDLYLNVISESYKNGHVSQKEIAPIYLRLTSSCGADYSNQILHCDFTALFSSEVTQASPITYFLLANGFKNFKTKL